MATNVYRDRDLVYVTPFANSTIKYGFMTNVDAGTQAILGHVGVTGTYPVGLVIGANAPKPGRASKETATGTESSFIDAGAVAEARAAGWKIRPGKIRVSGSSTRSKTVYVLHEANKLAWRMPARLYAKITEAERTALGIKDGTNTDLDLVFGVRYPQLPRVGKKTFGTDGTDTLSTFVDPSKLDSLPAGWGSLKASRVTAV